MRISCLYKCYSFWFQRGFRAPTYLDRCSHISSTAMELFKCSRHDVEIKEEEVMCIAPKWAFDYDDKQKDHLRWPKNVIPWFVKPSSKGFWISSIIGMVLLILKLCYASMNIQSLNYKNDVLHISITINFQVFSFVQVNKLVSLYPIVISYLFFFPYLSVSPRVNYFLGFRFVVSGFPSTSMCAWSFT